MLLRPVGTHQPMYSFPIMKWSKKTIMRSSKKEDVLMNDIVEALELEKSFFIHQVMSLYPIIARQNRFEGVAKKREFRIFGERLVFSFFMPFIISVTGKIEADGEGSKLEIKGHYTLLGKYFIFTNIILAIALITKMIFENTLADFGLVVCFILNAVFSFYLFPIWAERNFQKVEEELHRVIGEQNQRNSN